MTAPEGRAAGRDATDPAAVGHAAAWPEAADPAARELLARWDAQQAAYIAGREARFDALLDALEVTVGAAPVVLDIACGPGSLSSRILDRFPAARVVGVDLDPLLLHVAREALGDADGRLTLVEGDLAAPGWSAPLLDLLGGVRPDAVVSTTALHWLPAPDLLRVYREAHDALADGGVLLNGDHFRFDGRDPELRRLAAEHDERTQRASFAAGAPTWDAWWAESAAMPDAAPLVAERERRFADRPPSPPTAVDLHLAALAQAGFATVGTVWQLFDDYVVLARR